MTPMFRWWLALTLWVAARWLLPFVPVPTWLLSVVALIALLLSVAWLLWLAKEAGRLWSPLHALFGERIFRELLAVASGKPCKAELNGHREFQVWAVEGVSL